MLSLLGLSACRTALDVQGHRGCRGLYPENTIPAFLHALDLGVTTLELDLAISKDQLVVVSHEPYFNYEISLKPNGDQISQEDQRKFNLHQMEYTEIAEWDVGSRPVERFPEQKKMKVAKPLFKDMVRQAERYAGESGRRLPYYNIEIKSSPDGDGIYHPDVTVFSELVVAAVQELDIVDRTYIQSFDTRSLEAVKQITSDIPLVLLVGNEDGIEANLNRLSFTPQVYSPYFALLNKDHVENLQNRGIKVIPWTVNEEDQMKEVIDLKVDGIITDYPDRLLKLVKAL